MARSVSLQRVDGISNYANVAVLYRPNGDDLVAVTGTPATIAGVSIPSTLTETWCASQALSKKVGSVLSLRSAGATNLIIAVTNGTETTLDEWRRIGASIARAAGTSSVAVAIPVADTGASASVVQALTEGVILSSYDYKKPKIGDDVAVVPVGEVPQVVIDGLVAGVRTGSVIAKHVNWAKRLIDTPPAELAPKDFSSAAMARLEKAPHVDVDVWKESKIVEEKLGGLIGVNLGSAEPPRLVIADYKPPKNGEQRDHVILVGKGITFDSGGLSLKTGAGMMTMKTDMSGAAIVTAVIAIVAELELPIRVTAISPLTENVVGPKAMRPGDVLTIRNGKTVEVLNTDAEGRLVLADALSLAVERRPDAIIDVATLTGAAVVALGDEIAALFASDDGLAADLLRASAASGEALTRLPLFDAYESHIESDVADIKNIGKPGEAGSLSAALFLRHFVGDVPWAHFDIAGPGRAATSRGYYTKGATAFSARTLVQYLLNRSRPA